MSLYSRDFIFKFFRSRILFYCQNFLFQEKHTESASNLDDKNDDSDKEIIKLRNTSELEVRSQKEKLNHAMEGREMLKTILSKKENEKNDSFSSDTELSLDEPVESK